MKESFFKRTLSQLKPIYKELLPLSFSLVLLLLSIFALSMINEITSYLSFFLLLFLFLPLLLSIQLFATKIFVRKSNLDYKEVYKQMKLYYTPIFKGVYGVLSALLFSLLMIFLVTFIFVNVFVYIEPDLLLENPELFVEQIFNNQYFYLFLLIMMGVEFFAFIYKIFSKLTYPYFSCFCGIQKRYVKLFFRHLKNSKDYPYRRNMASIGIPLLLICFISYAISTIIVFNFTNNYNIALLVGLIISLFLGGLYFPIYLQGCYLITMDLKDEAMCYLKDQISKEYEEFVNNPNLSDEEKNFIKERYDQINKMFKDNDKDINDDDKKEKE